RELPERIEPYDLVILGAATHKLSRIVTKEKVTDPIRATVTHKPPGSPVDQERPSGEGMRHVLGELLTCPFCMGSWIAAALSYAFVLAPRHTRFMSTVFAIDAASDAMHCGFHRLKGS